jgi:pyrroloquinoline quinone biosynthesis protein D
MAAPVTHGLDCLNFAPGVRLHWSEVRQQHWLLFPEGALALSVSAAAILACCDGQHSLDDMVTVLQTQFHDVNADDVEKLLACLIDRGLLVKLLRL